MNLSVKKNKNSSRVNFPFRHIHKADFKKESDKKSRSTGFEPQTFRMAIIVTQTRSMDNVHLTISKQMCKKTNKIINEV